MEILPKKIPWEPRAKGRSLQGTWLREPRGVCGVSGVSSPPSPLPVSINLPHLHIDEPRVSLRVPVCPFVSPECPGAGARRRPSLRQGQSAEFCTFLLFSGYFWMICWVFCSPGPFVVTELLRRGSRDPNLGIPPPFLHFQGVGSGFSRVWSSRAVP